MTSERKTYPADAQVSPSAFGKSIARSSLSGAFQEKKTSYAPYPTFRDIENGVSAKRMREIAASVLTAGDIRTIIPDRTLDRRIANNEPLKLEEADGIARLLRVVGMARRVFGDTALADTWLRTPNPALADHVPITLARFDLGGREVEAVLGRIEHGVFG